MVRGVLSQDGDNQSVLPMTQGLCQLGSDPPAAAKSSTLITDVKMKKTDKQQLSPLRKYSLVTYDNQ